MDALLNATARRIMDDAEAYRVTRASITRNLRGPWVVENDPFEVNQFMHPYQGAMYHSLARSAGLNYWQSVAYTFAGSAFWEVFGETTSPSINDQIASGIAGSFLGESLFRIANLVVDKSEGGVGFRRGGLVALASPAVAFNRIVFGDRFDGVMETHDPAYDLRFQLGARGTSINRPGPSLELQRTEGIIDLFIEYGLPGKRGYSYRRPFDYFRLHATASSANVLERLTTHGLIVGTRYDIGPAGGGVWGLYGVYDYLAPQLFRVSTTTLSFGTSAEAWPSDAVMLQWTVLGGVGYAGAQSLRGLGDRDYHYGVSPQAIAEFRLVAGNRVSFDLAARQYFVSDIFPFDTLGRDVILRAEASVGVRLFGRNGVTVRYELSRRDASFPDAGGQRQARGTLGVYYTVLGPQRFGGVDRHR